MEGLLPIEHQQLVVEAAADRFEQGRGLCWVRDDLQDVALQRQDKNSASAFSSRVELVDFEVEAILRRAKMTSSLPLPHDRAAVLPSEREDLQAVTVRFVRLPARDVHTC